MTSQPQSPTMEEWRALYTAAGRFKDLKPWEWLFEDQLIGVVNPEDGEIGYCSVMGNLGEHLALAVYLGTEGLYSFFTMQDAADSPDIVDAFIEQQSLQASFEDREQLADEDRKVIKKLGLKFRGRQAWPLFRDCTPGYLPGPINAAQCRFLTLALEQVCDVAQRFQDNPEDLGTIEDGQCLIRVLKPTKKGSAWVDEWQDFPAEHFTPGIEATFAPADLSAWQKHAADKVRQGAIEVDYFYLPHPIQEDPAERPFFPQQILAVDHKAGFVYASDVTTPAMLGEAIVHMVTELLSKALYWPRQIEVRRTELVGLLAPLEMLGVAIVDAYGLPATEAAREAAAALLESFMEEDFADLEDFDLEE